MDLGLSGKRAVVTGASRGIGRAIAEALADEGCALAICARNEDGLGEAAERLRAKGVAVAASALDVGDGDALKAWVARAADELGGLDVFVSNTSAGSGQGEESWYRSFEVDLMGLVRGVEAATPHLERSDAGSVVVVGTTAAVETFRGPNSYGAVKAALLNYASALSQSLAPKGIRCNTVSPGPVYFEGGSWERIKTTTPPFYDQTLAAIPQGRMGTPEEVARVVAFVASPAASLVTGANLVADGGFTKRVDF